MDAFLSLGNYQKALCRTDTNPRQIFSQPEDEWIGEIEFILSVHAGKQFFLSLSLPVFLDSRQRALAWRTVNVLCTAKSLASFVLFIHIPLVSLLAPFCVFYLFLSNIFTVDGVLAGALGCCLLRCFCLFGENTLGEAIESHSIGENVQCALYSFRFVAPLSVSAFRCFSPSARRTVWQKKSKYDANKYYPTIYI